MIPQLSPAEQTALISSLAKPRLRRFRAATSGDRDAIALYLVDAELASHLHAALRFSEVTLREAIHRALSAKYGPRWFQSQRGMLDRTTAEAFSAAEAEVGVGAPPGKIIAQVMLGTWVSLLGRGDYAADGARAYYVRDLWEPALKKAFSVPRSELRGIAMRVNWARNRISHCEPVVFGLPMPGLGGPGIQVRLSPALLFRDIRALVAASDPAVSEWMGRWAELASLCQAKSTEAALAHIETAPGIRLIR